MFVTTDVLLAVMLSNWWCHYKRGHCAKWSGGVAWWIFSHCVITITALYGPIPRIHDDVMKCKHFPVPGEFHVQRPVTRSFDVFFDLRLNILHYTNLWQQCSRMCTFSLQKVALWRIGLLHWRNYANVYSIWGTSLPGLRQVCSANQDNLHMCFRFDAGCPCCVWCHALVSGCRSIFSKFISNDLVCKFDKVGNI